MFTAMHSVNESLFSIWHYTFVNLGRNFIIFKRIISQLITYLQVIRAGRGVHSIEAWTHHASWKKRMHTAYFHESMQEERLRRKERLSYLSIGSYGQVFYLSRSHWVSRLEHCHSRNMVRIIHTSFLIRPISVSPVLSRTSHLLNMNASIIRGSGVGPVMYVVNEADLQAVTPGNIMVKYADDTYLVMAGLQYWQSRARDQQYRGVVAGQ